MLEIIGLVGTFLLHTPATWPIVMLGSVITFIFLQTSRDLFIVFTRTSNKITSNEFTQPRLPIASYAIRNASCWSVIILAVLLMGVIFKLFIDILGRFLPKPTAS